jgi:hypothetical protein
MNRILAPLVVALATVVAGCGQTEVPRKTLPSATEKFDKKEVPNNSPSRGAAPG